MRSGRHTTATESAIEDRPTRLWSPSQLVALILGGAAIAFGVLALTKTGLDLSHLTRHHDTVLGFGHTPLLGLAEIGFGILMVLAAFGAIAGRNIMTLLGAAAIGLGVVLVAGWWSVRMSHSLGASDRNGWLFLAVGAISLVVAFVAPVWTTGGPHVVRTRAAAVPATETADRVPADATRADTTATGAPAQPRRHRFLPGSRRPAEAAAAPESGTAPEPASR
ncbi:MAG TPA: hypothetical protein VLV81_04345 [Acidimicrobiia bacterium]|nr:hypothetical protein [Acidimicrobiia bacterium]